jgi:hypothetical protein
MESKTQTQIQTQPCEQGWIDLQKLADEVRVKLRQGVRLSSGEVVAVNLSVNHLTYVKARDCGAEVKYAIGCVSVHVDVVADGGCVKIKDVRVNNLCSDRYGV